ncbi:type IV pilus twitching motility protein PilT [Microbacterium sp.]|uniref:type IV pilus twitching motility protein PilT n=1 Tax=Microbacterium sp. TaxID=51671 RepID=UPI00289AB3AF|nr:type IV pilus twitching motility protein PilT [Microbacterium sp.]
MVTGDEGYFRPSAGSRFDELFGGREVDPDLRSFLDGVPGVTLPPAAPAPTVHAAPVAAPQAASAPAHPVPTAAQPAPAVAPPAYAAPAPSFADAPEAPPYVHEETEADMADLFDFDDDDPDRGDAVTATFDLDASVVTPAPTAVPVASPGTDTWLPPAPAARRAYATPPAQKPVTGLAARAGEVEPVMRAQIPNVDPEFVAAVRAVLTQGASDLHLVAESTPVVRVDGELKSVAGTTVWTRERIRRVIESFVPADQLKAFETSLELDLAYAVGDIARFRVNVFQDQRGLGAALRIIPTEIKSVGQLGLPKELVDLANLPRGLVLVCGPTGSGKSTTLAAIIDRVNSTRASHIVTVEDPIEFQHMHKRGIINQREIGADTHSFGEALKRALRQDPDVILVGEMRDLETISTALTAAETGHLVFATLHTQDAAQTIDRVIDVYPAHQQAQVRTQLAATLRAVVVQTLIKKASGRGRTVATEVMFSTPAIASLIRAGKTHQLRTNLQAGTAMGMHTLDQDLARLVLSGEIEYGQAVEIAQDVAEFEQLVKNRGLNRLSSTEYVPEGIRSVAGAED